MQSMRFHCLAASSAVFLLTRFRGVTDRTWCELGGAPAELAKLHLAAAGFQGCAEGSPSTCSGASQMVTSRQCLTLHGVVVWGQALWCDSWLCLPICLTSSCLCQQTPGVSDHFFMVMAATIVCRPTHLDSIPQPRADPWVYRTIFHARRAHRQNLCCPVFPGVTSLFPVVS